MTKIKIQKFHGEIWKVVISGHSGYGTADKDIICSAISALGQNLIVGIKEVLNVAAEYEINDMVPLVGLLITERDKWKRAKAQGFLKAFEISVKEIAKEYPKYVEVEIC